MIKRAVFIALVATVGWYAGSERGWFGPGTRDAEQVYKRFMDGWIVGDYDRALQFAMGNARVKVSEARLRTGAQGDAAVPKQSQALQASSMKGLRQSRSGNVVELELIYSAAVGTPGSGAIGTGDWSRYRQSAALRATESGWKVEWFRSEKIDD